MTLANLLPVLKPLIAWVRQEKKIEDLEKALKEKDVKYEKLMNGFNKHLKGELIKSYGRKKTNTAN